MVRDGAFSHKIDYFLGDSKSRRSSKSLYWFKSYAILLNGLILPIGGASAVEGLLSMGPTLSSLDPFPIKFPIMTFKTYQHRK